MNKRTIFQTKEKDAANMAARKEGKVYAENLLAEIGLLLPDYFVGEFAADGEGILIKLLNGQVFRLSAEEVC